MIRSMHCGAVAVALCLVAMAHADAQAAKPGGKSMAISITSTAFHAGAPIPSKYTCEGENISPQLSWTGVPAGVKSLALICDDPDAPAGTWVHWVAFDLPVATSQLPEKQPASLSLPGGGRQGTNDFKRTGYGGPCPPPGKAHRYFFKLYALDAPVALKPGATKQELVRAMEGHIVAEGQLMGTCQRRK